MSFFKGKTTGAHFDLDLYTPYQRYMKDTKDIKYVLRAHKIKCVSIFLLVLLTTFFILVPKYGFGVMIMGFITGSCWGLIPLSHCKNIAKNHAKTKEKWENCAIPLKDNREECFKTSQRLISYLIIIIFFVGILTSIYLQDTNIVAVPIFITIVSCFVLIGVIILRAYLHGEVNLIRYKVENGNVKVIDSDDKDISDFYDVLYENQFMPLSSEDRVKKPNGYVIKKHLCNNCKENISKKEQFCTYCKKQQF